MNRIAHCPACTAQRRGIKSRISYPHTCGMEQRQFVARQEEKSKKTLEQLKKEYWEKPLERFEGKHWTQLFAYKQLGKFE